MKPVHNLAELDELTASITYRVGRGRLFCESHPDDSSAAVLLHELSYRERYLKLLCINLHHLVDDESGFADTAFPTAPFARSVQLCASLLAARAGNEPSGFFTILAAYIAKHELDKLEELTVVDARKGFNLEEYKNKVLNFTFASVNAWRELRSELTGIVF